MWIWLGLALTADQPAHCVQAPYGILPSQKKPFVCSLAKDRERPSINWPGRKATYRINAAGTQDVAGTRELAEIRASFDTWTKVVGAQFQFVDGGITSSTSVGFDYQHLDRNENVVFFQSDWPHDHAQIALTTTTHNLVTGEIFDADMEINDQDWQFSTGDDEVAYDVRNTVTHEVGHFIGFAHPDEEDSTIDLECASTATMSRSASFGETSKRALAPTDEMGMRFVYPNGKPNGFCAPPDAISAPAVIITQVSASAGGCAQHGEPLWLAGLLGLRAFKARARKRNVTANSA